MHYAWCTFVLCGIICATYFQYEEFDSENIMFLTRILYFSEYISGIVSTAFIFIGCQYQRNRYAEYFRRFTKTSLRLATFGVAVDFADTKKLIRRFLFGYLAFFAIIVFTDFMYNRSNLREFLRSCTVYSIPNIILAMALAEYFLLLHLLAQCYARVRIILQGISRETACLAKIQLNIPERDLIHIHKWLVNRCPYMSEEQKVEQLRLLCLELSQLNHEVTSSFGLLVISTLLSTFIILSIQFYTFYTIFEGFVKTDGWLTVYTTLWVILHGGKTFLILLFNQLVSDEVN